MHGELPCDVPVSDTLRPEMKRKSEVQKLVNARKKFLYSEWGTEMQELSL